MFLQPAVAPGQHDLQTPNYHEQFSSQFIQLFFFHNKDVGKHI